MAEFNSCAALTQSKEFTRFLQECESMPGNIDLLQKMLNTQNLLQEDLFKRLNRTIPPLQIHTKGELIDFLIDQKLAFDDEFRELIESCHGMSRPDSERSAAWKKWKSKYSDIRNEAVNEKLTDDDIAEKHMELIDMLHFVFNMCLALGMDSKLIYAHYMAKNAENFARASRGY